MTVTITPPPFQLNQGELGFLRLHRNTVDALRVKVYRNLNRRDMPIYSVSHKNRVRDYSPAIGLANCKFKHATAAQTNRCRQGGSKGTGRREVCQWITGDVCYFADLSRHDWRRLVSDPKKALGFCDAETTKQVDRATYVLLKQDGSAWYADNDPGDRTSTSVK